MFTDWESKKERVQSCVSDLVESVEGCIYSGEGKMKMLMNAVSLTRGR